LEISFEKNKEFVTKNSFKILIQNKNENNDAIFTI
jgi:hypothetical protein